MMREIDKIALIDLAEGKVLMTRSLGKTNYYLPGGKREPGETDEQTLIREIKEELDVAILPETISYLGTFTAQADGYKEPVHVKMTCYRANYQGTLQASSEIEEIRWMNYKHRDLVAEVDKIIFDYLINEGLLT